MTVGLQNQGKVWILKRTSIRNRWDIAQKIELAEICERNNRSIDLNTRLYINHMRRRTVSTVPVGWCLPWHSSSTPDTRTWRAWSRPSRSSCRSPRSSPPSRETTPADNVIVVIWRWNKNSLSSYKIFQCWDQTQKSKWKVFFFK